MKIKTPSLGIIIPALNEEKSLGIVVQKLIDVIQDNNISAKIIIINDGSSDNTLSVALKLREQFKDIEVINNKNSRNIGHCYRQGFERLSTDYITWFPADGEISPSVLKTAYPLLKEDTVILTHPHSNKYTRPLQRRVLSHIYQRFLNFSLSTNIKYFNGNSFYPRSVFLNYSILSKGFTINAELIIRAIFQLNYKFVEIPFTLKQRHSGKSKAISLKQFLNVGLQIFFLIRKKNNLSDEK